MINRYQKSLVKGDLDKVKVAIIGSRIYENKRKIKDTIFKLKQLFGDKLEIVSGGAQNGADRYAKKYALELAVDYKEFNPAFTNKNLYSVMPESYYGKQFHVSQLFARNELIAKYCDKMIAFIHSNSATSGSEHAVKMAQKHKKPVVIINEL
jgi:predicted Rossmann fold nucleotide-binding protein DprA/Smf involved in DNA uptake